MTAEHETAKTVLIVEDEAVIRQMIADVMADLGYRPLQARDAAAALEIAETPVLMICDIGLPGKMRGGALAEQARRRWPGLKVLFITGHGEPARGPVDMRPGNALLTKPFTIDALEDSIRSLLGEA